MFIQLLNNFGSLYSEERFNHSFSSKARAVCFAFVLASVAAACQVSRINSSTVNANSNGARASETPVVSIGENSPTLPPSTPTPMPTAPLVASPSAAPTASATRAPSPEISSPPTANGAPALSPVLQSTKLLIPVVGVRAEQLRDTFNEARSQGRVHNAIDIPAAHNTPVVAAADGRIVKLFQSKLGGTTIYQLGTDERTVFYYAHLDHYADGIAEGTFAHRGETIGYVGDTGNAGAGNYHLHFAIWVVSDPKHFWDGVDINPYPLLK
jgi:murein DD-endopeptidase MepM/ murein hydrolase activator NlpD